MPHAVPTSKFSLLQEELKTHYTAEDPGIYVSVYHKGHIIFEEGHGVANILIGSTIDRQTNFRMASVTKQFTAMAVALLEQAGLLSFQDTLTHFLPEVGVVGHAVTLEQLLTHTSGLRDYEDGISEIRHPQVTDEEVVQIVASSPTHLFSPGSAFRYSNTGYVLLGKVVGKVAGQPFPQFIEEKIFSPLSITHSCFYNSLHPSLPIPHRALGYAQEPSGAFQLADQSACSATQGDGCLYTSVQDYGLWHQALQPGTLFPVEPLLQKIQAPVEAGKNWFYGMGWFFAPRRNGSLEMYHTGNSSGFSHLVVHLPEENAGVIAFSNRKDNPHLLPRLLEAVLQEAPFHLESELVWALPSLTR